MDLGLKDRKGVVTGGSRGIGLGIARVLADEGCDVAVCARHQGPLEAAVEGLNAGAGRVRGDVVDISDGPALRGWVRAVAEDFGGLDFVVANVSAFAIGESDAEWEKTFQTDLMGTVRLVDAALPFLKRSPAGAILAVSSIAARELDFAARPYGAMKAAIVHYAKSLSRDLGRHGIRVNVLTPGHTFFEGGGWERIGRENPDLYAHSLSLSPSGRMGSVEEIARAAAFLLSPAASFVSGANLVVDGGLTRAVDL